MKLNLNKVSLQISAGVPGQFPRENVPQIAFSGRSNVGKSSLINCLLLRKNLAHVSSTPGKTVTVNFYNVDRKILFADLPGYGFAKRTLEEKKRWSGLTDAYFTGNAGISNLKCVIQLIDGKVGPTKDDITMLDYLRETGMPFMIVYTKTDKLNATAKKTLTDSFGTVPGAIKEILFSSETKAGRDELLSEICRICNID